MRSPIFQHIGSRGYFWFLLFQLFSSDDVDGTTQPTGQHPLKNMVIGGEGSYIPSVNHSLSVSLGPKVHMYLLDCRSERRIDRICSELTYQRMFEEIESLPDEVEQLIVQLGKRNSRRVMWRRRGLILSCLHIRRTNRLSSHVIRRAFPGEQAESSQHHGQILSFRLGRLFQQVSPFAPLTSLRSRH